MGGMKCAQCQFDVSADFAFCPGCGSKLTAAAPVIAATLATPAIPVTAEADRRSATVLFADLSGFTAISERLDPEDVRALQTDLFGALRGVIERLDAFLEKFVGDAVMAVFGAPVAHEDDPQRALHAALEMHACAAVLSERWRNRIGHPLTLHIGVNTGRVVAGRLGSAADAAYAVTGDTVNTAARLQAAAAAGQTLVSGATFQLTQQEFTFESGGTLRLKGKSEPFPVHSLLGVVRRGKALSSSGCESRPATFAPAGSNRSNRGGNEAVEAFGVEGPSRDLAIVQAVTRVNVEQASKEMMRKPTRQHYGEGCH